MNDMATFKLDPDEAKRLGFRPRKPVDRRRLFVDLRDPELLEEVRRTAQEHGASISAYLRGVLYLVVRRGYDRVLPIKEMRDAQG